MQPFRLARIRLHSIIHKKKENKNEIMNKITHCSRMHKTKLIHTAWVITSGFAP